MKKQFFPLALGLVATISAPAQAAANPQPAEFDNPVAQDMPVAPDSAPTPGSSASGILSFEPPGATSTTIASAASDGAIAVESSAPEAKAEPCELPDAHR